MTNAIDRVVVDVLIIKMETDYLRFEEDCWYRFNREKDCYERVVENYEEIESIFISTKENS